MGASLHGMSAVDRLMIENLNGGSRMLEPLPQVFGYLLPSSITHENTGPNDVTGGIKKAKIVEAIDALADTMMSNVNMEGPADAGMTFFGQFVDHDITLDVTSAIGKKIDVRTIRDVRTPNLDLDCVYGAGPDGTPHMYHPTRSGELLFGNSINANDLARNSHGTALIGDPRNDENIIVSQVQGIFIQLHNILMSGMAAGGAMATSVHDCAAMGVRNAALMEERPPVEKDFELSRRFVRLHYQWLVLHELLPSFVTQRCIDLAMQDYVFGDDGAILPTEFSGACYRFGHATVQQQYTLRAGKQVGLFDMQGFGPRSSEHDIDFGLFFGKGAQKARPVGTQVAKTLFALPQSVVSRMKDIIWKDDNDPDEAAITEAQFRKLAVRNMLRDRSALKCASGQQVARWLGKNVPDFAVTELGPHPELTKRGITKTPLWYYALAEADHAKEGKLDGVGGLIVASVIVRILRLERESILGVGFKPWSEFGDNFSFRAMADWVVNNKNKIVNPVELMAG